MKWLKRTEARPVWLALILATLPGLMTGAIILSRRADPCYVDRQAEEYLLPTPMPGVEPGASPGGGEEEAGAEIAAARGPRLADLEPLRSAESWRFGIGVPGGVERAAWVPRLGAGWWLSWGVLPPEALTGEVEFLQMVRLRRGTSRPPVREVARLARNAPGQEWIIGNEPDVKWQDNVTPACYAKLYHDLHSAIKRADPTARVAVAGVAQGSSLRLAYLDAILQSYQERYREPLPVDVWTLHGFVLPELRGSWGVDIPPGIEKNVGRLYGVTDHDNLAAFQEQIIAFRRWMAARGYRDYPLVITEYGILMPTEYGFPEERVRQFMSATFDFFLSARDPELGYPGDENRLVQRWAWFSLDFTLYPIGNLIDPESGTLTGVGESYREYVGALP